MTEDVQDYVLDYRQGNTLYEIHLIDSPGFDDGNHVDAEVLSRIATYINHTYLLKQTLAGVLYLHDITKGKMGGGTEESSNAGEHDRYRQMGQLHFSDYEVGLHY